MNCNYKGRKQAEKNQRVIEAYLWFAMITLNREMGFGAKQLDRFRAGFIGTVAEFDRECQRYGVEVAILHVRQRVQQIMENSDRRKLRNES